MRATQLREFLAGLTRLVADAVRAGNVEAQAEQFAAALQELGLAEQRTFARGSAVSG